jgi:hypothetical protein
MGTQNSKLNVPHSPAIHSGGQVWRIIRRRRTRNPNYAAGSALVVVVVSLLILLALGIGILMVAWGARHKAIRFKNEAAAMLAAEAGYEQAVFWMSRQQDVLTSIYKGAAGTSGALSFPDADCDYQIKLFSFAGYRPVYQVISIGHSGVFDRTVDVRVIQAISGWAMGMCRVPYGTTSTYPVNFANGEIIDIPIHINKLPLSIEGTDDRDIYIIGSPHFLQDVGMGESRYRASGGGDKYASVMSLFEGGIYFNQPDCKITDEATVQGKVDRFKDSTKPAFRFTPSSPASITNKQQAVQLEFFVDGGVGKVRITNNCAVRGLLPSTLYDYKIKPGTSGTQYERYYLYAYHVRPTDADSTGERFVCPIEQTYVTQSIGGVESDPGGQIFIDGNVIIGSGDSLLPGQDMVKGKVTVVATGNIWLADSTVVDGTHNADGKPSQDNPNVLGLVAQGVVKVVDPGMTDPSYVNIDPTTPPSGYTYVPIALADSGQPADSRLRHLPDPTVVEAAMTVGGGGWGAEDVGGRKEFSSPQDDLIVRGTITEAVRGVVGVVGTDGYLKHYYFDERLLEGILPGDMWLQGKYIPAPAGWHDYRAAN